MITAKGVNFSVAAPDATRLELLIYEHSDDINPKQIIELGNSNRSGDYWHIEVEGLTEGSLYGFRAFGPKDSKTNRFFSSKVLLDPCARAISGWEVYQREEAIGGNEIINYCL